MLPLLFLALLYIPQNMKTENAEKVAKKKKMRTLFLYLTCTEFRSQKKKKKMCI